jgi:signal transduction histidine kinase
LGDANLLKLFKTLQDDALHYNDDLIKLFLSVSYKSSVAYIASVVVFSFVFFSYIPSMVFILIIGLHVFYQAMRFHYLNEYKNQDFTEEKKSIFLEKHVVLMFVGSLTWSISCYIAIHYAPPHYEYMMLFLIVSIAAGSISTLSSIFRAYVAFNLPMIIVLIVTFIFHTSEFHYYIAAVLPVFSYVLMSASWEMHKSLKRTMELKDLYSESQEELKAINSSLEVRIKEAVDENRQKDQQMLAQSRLAQMGEMLSMIAHQWKQPLSSITATTGAMTLHMQLDDCDEEVLEKKIEKINTYTQYLSSTINDFRDFFKPDKAKRETSLSHIVNASIKIIGSSLKADGIEVKTVLDSKEKLHTYPNELQQVVLNLLKNAKDAYIQKNIKNAEIVIKTYDEDNHAVLEVCDSAGGIKENDMPHIFNPYYTTKEDQDGTGLGLYMSKLILEKKGMGHIKVENIQNGALFSIGIPIDS